MDELSPSTKIIDKITKVIGERDIMPDILMEKLPDLKDWNIIVEHQRLLIKSLRRDISLQAALLDYLISTELMAPETHLLELPPDQKAAYTSIIDPLTGLYNDRHFLIIVEAELSYAKKYSLPMTMLMFDADNFGMYTALYGHETADVALKEMSFCLKNSCRKEDILFRLKKNRFVILLLNINREGAHKLGERIRINIERFHFKGEEKLSSKKLTVSGGIAVYPEDGKNSHTLLMAAEEALITAKESGRNRVLEYSVKRRKNPRIELTSEAKYQVEGRRDIKPQTVYLQNISESGVLIKAAREISLGGIVMLTFKLPNGKPIKTKGETVRISKKESTNETFAAIRFTDIPSVDLLNLRNYIQEVLGR